MAQSSNETINKKRVYCSLAYLIISIFIVLIRRDHIFYLSPFNESYNFDRFLWCLSSSFFGFAVLAFSLRHHQKTPFPVYYSYYPFVLIGISTLVFSILHLFDKTSSFVFYYFSFARYLERWYTIINLGKHFADFFTVKRPNMFLCNG